LSANWQGLSNIRKIRKSEKASPLGAGHKREAGISATPWGKTALHEGNQTKRFVGKHVLTKPQLKLSPRTIANEGVREEKWWPPANLLEEKKRKDGKVDGTRGATGKKGRRIVTRERDFQPAFVF